MNLKEAIKRLEKLSNIYLKQYLNKQVKIVLEQM